MTSLLDIKKLSSNFLEKSIDLYNKNKLLERDRFILEHKKFKKYADKDLFEMYEKMKLKFTYDYVMDLSPEELNIFLEINILDISGSISHKYAVIIKLLNLNMIEIDSLKNKDFHFYDNSKIKEKIESKENISIEELAKSIYPKNSDYTQIDKVINKLEILDNPIDYIKLILKIIETHGEIPKSKIQELIKNINKLKIEKFSLFVNFFKDLNIKASKLLDLIRYFSQLEKNSLFFFEFLLNRYKGLYLSTSLHQIQFRNIYNFNIKDDDVILLFSFFPENPDIYNDLSFLGKISGIIDIYNIKTIIPEKLITNAYLYKKFVYFGNYLFTFFEFIKKTNETYEKLEKILIYTELLLGRDLTIYPINIIEDIFNSLLDLNNITRDNIYYHTRGIDGIDYNDFVPGNIDQKVARCLLFLNHVEFNIRNILYIFSVPLETSLVNKFRQNHIPNLNIYAGVLNVHTGNRDKKTIHALKELIKTWNPSSKDIDKYFNKFWKNRKMLNEKQKEAFLRVLGVDDNLEKINRNLTDFGGLLSSKIIIGGIEIDPREFIARFWRFAVKSDESENLKTSIMMSIINSLQGEREHKYVICNPGKIQQLVVAVLQGRLVDSNGKIIDIDGTERIENIKNGEIIEDLNLINSHIQPFISWIFGLEELFPKNISEFFEGLFKYIIELKNTGIILSPEKVVYSVIMTSINKKGIVINPEMSICGSFEDMFQIEDYLLLYKDKENIG